MIRDYIELARVSNLPTVVSNVLVGLVAGAMAEHLARGYRVTEFHEFNDLAALLTQGGGLLLIVAGCCFYTMGMVLNDVADVAIDRIERPHRPLPSGRVSLRRAHIFVAVLGIVGIAALLPLRSIATLTWAALLIAAIVAYDLLHKRFAGSIIIMGLCRTLLYLFAASASAIAHAPAWWRTVLPFTIIVGVYTVCITLIARMENEAAVGRRRWAAVLMPILVLPAILFILPRESNVIWSSIAAAVLVFWLARAAALVFTQPPQTKRAVMTWLSGMCLIDAYFLALMGWPITALIAGVCFVATVIAHRSISGT